MYKYIIYIVTIRDAGKRRGTRRRGGGTRRRAGRTLFITCKRVDGRAEAAAAMTATNSTVATAMRLELLAFIVVTRRRALNVNKQK